MRADPWTSIVAPVPEAEAAVAGWRSKLDPWAARGVPAHVTLLGPFLPAPLVDDGVVAELASIFGRRRPLELRFAAVAHLPGAVALLPADSDALHAITEDLVAVWPALRAGRRTGMERAYHLTVACTDDPVLAAVVEREVGWVLPIEARVDEVVLLLAAPGEDVRERARFSLER